MSSFFYRAKDKNNKIINDFINAKDITDAARLIQTKGLTVLEIKEDENKLETSINIGSTRPVTRNTTLSLREKKAFFTSFYDMYSSGLSMIEIFKSIMHSARNTKISGICNQILRKLDKGSSLKDAMLKYSYIFGKAYTMLVIAGEASGQLQQVLADIKRNIEKQEEIRNKIIGAIAYPGVIFFFAIGTGLFYSSFLNPLFALMSLGITRVDVFRLLLITILQIVFVFGSIAGITYYIARNKIIINRLIMLFFNIPPFQNFIINYYFSNYFSILSLSFKAGVPPAESVSLANSVIIIPRIKERLKKAEYMITDGCEITTAFNVANVFSNYAMSQVSSGEKSGNIEQMFASVANDYERKFDLIVNTITQILPIIALLVAAIPVVMIATNGYNSLFGFLTGF